jgi:hypothetical protein
VCLLITWGTQNKSPHTPLPAMFIVQEYLVAWILAGSALVLTTIAIILNAIFGFSLDSTVPAVQLLAFVAFAINILAICGLTITVSHYIPKLRGTSAEWSTALCWRFVSMAVTILSVAAVLTFITLVWAAVRTSDLPEVIAGRPGKAILTAWFVIWGAAALLQVGAYAFIAWWTKRALYSRSLAAMDLDFGVGSPEMGQASGQPRPTSESFRSQDPTLTSPPQTPTTIAMSSPFGLSHSGGKNAPTSSRTRLVHSTSFTRESAKSSFDYSSSERVSIEHPFDRWDTSSVTRDVRTTLHSSPPVTRSGLETIPGSRPESPAKALDGPFLPESPHATTSDAATAVDSSEPSGSRKASMSSPPSSPPNFSRPTSRQINHPTMTSALNQGSLDLPPEELIHPLFRPSSPHPAPIASAGTMVTASPLAGQQITPKTLTRMRSASMPQQPSPLKEYEMPPPDPESSTGTPGPGSPGPSIVEDEDLPPVIPGFVLGAGQRSSFVGYGKRKSVKSRPASFHSQGSRLSMIMP